MRKYVALSICILSFLWMSPLQARSCLLLSSAAAGSLVAASGIGAFVGVVSGHLSADLTCCSTSIEAPREVLSLCASSKVTKCEQELSKPKHYAFIGALVGAASAVVAGALFIAIARSRLSGATALASTLGA